jgi:hypothetical protein
MEGVGTFRKPKCAACPDELDAIGSCIKVEETVEKMVETLPLMLEPSLPSRPSPNRFSCVNQRAARLRALDGTWSLPITRLPRNSCGWRKTPNYTPTPISHLEILEVRLPELVNEVTYQEQLWRIGAVVA